MKLNFKFNNNTSINTNINIKSKIYEVCNNSKFNTRSIKIWKQTLNALPEVKVKAVVCSKSKFRGVLEEVKSLVGERVVVCVKLRGERV